MGNNYEGQERAIEELSALSMAAKEYLNHHICNALTVISAAARLGHPDMVETEVQHIVDDLILAGIRHKSFRR
ncbi:MAG: hypothetical protein M0Z71_12480 [Nitrospiraceae bacterium]|nr:hypothetical protein [Nitrospiraceae bacterium]